MGQLTEKDGLPITGPARLRYACGNATAWHPSP